MGTDLIADGSNGINDTTGGPGVAGGWSGGPRRVDGQGPGKGKLNVLNEDGGGGGYGGAGASSSATHGQPYGDTAITDLIGGSGGGGGQIGPHQGP